MIDFILGESRPLEFEIIHQNGDEFIIREAKFELYKDDVIVDSGDMDIDGHLISYIFEPEERGYYLLEFSYIIGPTTRKARYKIKVN